MPGPVATEIVEPPGVRVDPRARERDRHQELDRALDAAAPDRVCTAGEQHLQPRGRFPVVPHRTRSGHHQRARAVRRDARDARQCCRAHRRTGEYRRRPPNVIEHPDRVFRELHVAELARVAYRRRAAVTARVVGQNGKSLAECVDNVPVTIAAAGQPVTPHQRRTVAVHLVRELDLADARALFHGRRLSGGPAWGSGAQGPTAALRTQRKEVLRCSRPTQTPG